MELSLWNIVSVIPTGVQKLHLPHQQSRTEMFSYIEVIMKLCVFKILVGVTCFAFQPYIFMSNVF